MARSDERACAYCGSSDGHLSPMCQGKPTGRAGDERAAVLESIRLTSRHGSITVTLTTLREVLAAQGLHVVTAAQMRVLEAMGEVAMCTVRNYAQDDEIVYCESSWRKPAEAELARREGER